MNIAKPGVGIRLASMLLDYLFICVILVPLFMLSRSLVFSSSGPGVLQFVLIGIMIVSCFKDSFRGKSLAKRLLKLQVVDNESDAAATIGQCFVRNLSFIVWPVEVIVALFNSSRRIGDFMANTKLVALRPSR